MPIIAPFRGIRYNQQKVGDLDRVITQPYDKITPAMQEDYYHRSEYNYVRLIRNQEENPYAASRATYERWYGEQVLIRDRLPAIYPYRQIFTVNGRTRVRRGLTCLCKLEPLEGGRVLPHERTLSKPKEDRLNLMRATRKQFEQVFMLYADDEDRVNKILAPIWKWTPDIEVTDEYGTIHCLWTVTDTKTIHTVQQIMKPKKLVIADGHHRYETALSYRDELRKKLSTPTGREAFNYRQVTCVNLNDPALTILPTHRLIASIADFNLNEILSRISKYFNIATKVSRDETAKHLAGSPLRRGQAIHSFVLYGGGERTCILTLRSESDIARMFAPDRSPDYRSLDVAILHTVIIENLLGIKPEQIEDHVRYEGEWKNALAEVDKGAAQLAFLIHPTRPEQVKKIAENWERMPQKSTDFYPKLISGLVLLDVDDNELIA
jgi:uncharacterized protein (DUF1015 family)